MERLRMAATDRKEHQYNGYRLAAYQIAVTHALTLSQSREITEDLFAGLRITAINDAALSELVRQWRKPHFAWTRICGQSRPYVKRFEAALWIDDALEGLCMGRPSHGPDNLTLHFLEQRPSPSRLKGFVADIAFDAAEAYASLLGKRRLKLKDPAAGAVPLYEALGFRFAARYRGVVYYERGIP